MSDESPSCNVGLRFVYLNTLMYLTFRRLKSKNEIHVLSSESKGNVILIMLSIDAWVPILSDLDSLGLDIGKGPCVSRSRSERI